jgi:sigma-B regulation protein RsbU (phosphoserine phosphatase)
MSEKSAQGRAPDSGSWLARAALAGSRLLTTSLRRQITADIAPLALSAQELGQGNLNAAVPTPKTPELAPLAHALEGMRDDLAAGRAMLQRSTAEEVRGAWELEVARDIQQSFLPQEFPEIQGAEVAAMMQAARDVGGDFYDIIPLSGDRIGILVADVAGKGFPASLYMALARTLLRTHSLSCRPRYLSEAMESAQVRQLMRSGSSGALAALGAVRLANDYFEANHSADGMFFTLFYAVYEPFSRRLVYVNAGHNPPLLFNAATSAQAWLEPTDLAIGFVPGRLYEPQERLLVPGDILVLYTDGVTEAFDPARCMFGEERLQEVVRAHTQHSATDLVEAIVAAVHDHAGAAPQSDDITLLVLRISDQGQ